MGNKGSNTTTTSSAPAPQAMQAYQYLLDRAGGVAQTPFQAYGGDLTAPVNAQQNLGIANINQGAGFAQPYIQQASDYARQAAQPLTQAQIQQYQSPHTQAVVDATSNWFNQQNQQQQQNVLGNAAAQGALGGDRVGVAQANLAAQQTASQAPIIAGLYNQGYNTALQTAQQQQANLGNAAYSFGNLGVAGQNAALTGANAQVGAGSLQQQNEQQRLNALYQQWQIAQAFPYQQTQWLAGINTGVGSQMGGTGSTTAPAPDPTAQYIGAAMSGAAMVMSDRDAKEGIHKIGETKDGQPIYRYRYKGKPDWHIGLIAQEVEKSHPDAVHAGVDGTRYVDIKSATDDAARAFGGRIPGFAPGGAADDAPFAGVGWIPGRAITIGRGAPPPPGVTTPPAGPDFTKMAMSLAGRGGSPGVGSPLDISSGVGGFSPSTLGETLPMGLSPQAGFGMGPIYRDGGGVHGYDFGGGVGDAGVTMSDAAPDGMPPGAQLAQSIQFQISPGAGGKYSVIDVRTGQVRYSGSLDGARQAQAQLLASGRANGGFVRGYDLGGDVVDEGPMTFGNRWAPVPEAIALGSAGGFDPQGANASFASMEPSVSDAGVIPLPRPRPDEAPQGVAAADIDTATGASTDGVSGFAAQPDTVPPRISAPFEIPPEQSAEQPTRKFGLGLLPDNLRMPLLTAGLAMMASRSPNLGNAIGEGGLAGVGAYTQQKQQELTHAEKKESLAQTNRRLDLDSRRLDQAADQARKTLALHTAQAADLSAYRKGTLERENNKLIGTNEEGFPVYVNTRTGVETVGTTKLQGKAPAGYVRNADGSMAPIKGGPADPEHVAAVAKAKSTGGILPDDTASFLADRILAGDSRALTNLGRGAQGAENVIKVQTLAARKAAERGMNPSDILAKVAEQSGLTAQQRTFGTQVARMAVNSTEAEGAIHQGLEVSKKVGRSRFVPINKLVQMGAANISDPDLLEFRAANLAIINTYARAISPTGVPTVHDKEEAMKVVSEATSAEAYERVMQRMLKEIAIAHAAPLKAKQEMENIRKSGSPTGDHTATPAAPGTPKIGEEKQFKQGVGVWNGTAWVPKGQP